MARSRSRSPRDRSRERRRRSKSRSRSSRRRDRSRSRSKDRHSRRDREKDDRSPKRREPSASPPREDSREERRRKRRSGWDNPVTQDDVARATTTIGAGAQAGQPIATAPIQAMIAQLRQQLAVLQADQTTELSAKLAKQQALAMQIQQLEMSAGGVGFGVAPAMSMGMPSVSPMLRRIYVGSLDYSVTTDMIRTLFSPFGSIVNVDMPIDPMTRRSKGFVFVDFLDQASAEAAMSSMNGFQLLGRPMKVNRPSMPGGAAAVPTPALGGFSGMPTMMNLGGAVGGAPVSVGAMLSGAASAAPSPGGVDAATAAARAAALAQTIAGPNSGFGNPKARIYVGSVPFEISAEQLKAVFSAFGDVRSCELLPGSDLSAGQQHRGYGFIEFADESVAQAAMQAMNGFELAGRRLKVGPAASSQTAAAAGPVALGSGGLPSLGGPLPMFPVTAAPAPAPPPVAVSRTVLLENLVGPDEVDDELVGEIREECEKYGAVETVSMLPLEPGKPGGDIVKAAVTFVAPADAAKAITNLHRRYFGGRVISAKVLAPTEQPQTPAPTPASAHAPVPVPAGQD